jgi:hypothetical protein
MRTRPLVQAGNLTIGSVPGPSLENFLSQTSTADANTAITAQQVMGGILYRSGLTAGRTDTFPTVDSILAAMDNPQVGDSWTLIIRVNEAFALTLTAGTGMVAGVGTTTSVAASSTRYFKFTLLATKRTTIKIGTTTNADPAITKIPVSDLKDIMPGMLATGTNVGAAAIVLGLQEYIDATDGNRYGKATLSVNSTGTADNIAVTFTPRVSVDSPGIHGN